MENGLLIVRPLFKTGSIDRAVMHDEICKQLEKSNVVVLPSGWEAVTEPSNIKVAEKTEEESTPWELVDHLIFCTECGITIEYYDPMYQYCPYCGKRHYFEKEEKHD